VSKLGKPLAITGLSVFSFFIAVVIWVEITTSDSAVISHVSPDFSAISSALRTYKINAGHYPSTEQGLKALVERPTIPPFPDDWVQIADRVPTDPWKNEYRYRCFPEGSPHPFELISNGPDGIEGTKDDRSSSDR
jgi:general secretion pathway protein G